jgi:hypothetical protein
MKIEAFKGKRFLPEFHDKSVGACYAALPCYRFMAPYRDIPGLRLSGWTNRPGLITKAALPFIFGVPFQPVLHLTLGRKHGAQLLYSLIKKNVFSPSEYEAAQVIFSLLKVSYVISVWVFGFALQLQPTVETSYIS